MHTPWKHLFVDMSGKRDHRCASKLNHSADFCGKLPPTLWHVEPPTWLFNRSAQTRARGPRRAVGRARAGQAWPRSACRHRAHAAAPALALAAQSHPRSHRRCARGRRLRSAPGTACHLPRGAALGLGGPLTAAMPVLSTHAATPARGCGTEAQAHGGGGAPPNQQTAETMGSADGMGVAPCVLGDGALLSRRGGQERRAVPLM